MGLVILIIVGALLGWLASIVTRTEDTKGIFANAGIGAAAAVLAGGFANSGSILLGISGISLVAAVLGALVALAAFYAFRRSNLVQ